ncbi:helix-turn-helix domain-containing protein [Desulfotruncus alcoholivorax]|uniref:helix-turn-helix domain-containing protein n=1 Tax=Desulfotruncus alcoholivorax TaxID=265477 RepID=UPI00214F2CE0|nr:helix-turn-helix transcriptional regulator [Desulfotruncus alcoholivorax]
MIIIFSRDKFSYRLKELRKSRSVKQKELGQIVGLAESAINNLENKRRSPSIEIAVALADFFDVSLDYLVGRSDDPRRH